MSGAWGAIIGASLLVFALKLAGYLVPQRLVQGPLLSRIATLVTVGLLSSLVVSQTLASPDGLVIDARLPAIAVALGLLLIRAPFIVVIIGAAVTAAVLRALGWMA